MLISGSRLIYIRTYSTYIYVYVRIHTENTAKFSILILFNVYVRTYVYKSPIKLNFLPLRTSLLFTEKEKSCFNTIHEKNKIKITNQRHTINVLEK